MAEKKSPTHTHTHTRCLPAGSLCNHFWMTDKNKAVQTFLEAELHISSILGTFWLGFCFALAQSYCYPPSHFSCFACVSFSTQYFSHKVEEKHIIQDQNLSTQTASGLTTGSGLIQTGDLINCYVRVTYKTHVICSHWVTAVQNACNFASSYQATHSQLQCTHSKSLSGFFSNRVDGCQRWWCYKDQKVCVILWHVASLARGSLSE